MWWGPCALRKSLYRNGWTIQTPFVLQDKYGTSLHLLTVSPKRIRAAFSQQMREMIAFRSIVKQYAASNDDCQERKALFERGGFMQPLYALFEQLPPREAYTLLRIVCNGIFTNNDLMLYGYDIDPVCTFCGNSADTVYHRCFTCPGISTRAELALGPELYSEILEAGPDSILANRCLRPAFLKQEEPSPTTVCEFIDSGDGDSLLESDGEVFGDGSCYDSSYSDLAHSGFAVVQLDSNDQVLRAIYGCVPSIMPQTSLAAEYAAFYTFVAFSSNCVYVGDCQDVLSGFEGPFSDALGPSSMHACTWKACLLKGGRKFKDKVKGVVKVKAHRALSDVEGPAEIRRFKGNEAADDLAKRGALLHPPNNRDVLLFKQQYKAIRSQAVHMIDCLKNLSLTRRETQGRLRRLPDDTSLHLLPQIDSKPSKQVHSFRWHNHNKCWICDSCMLRTLSLAGLASRNAVCNGPPAFKNVLNIKGFGGHELWSAGIHGGGVMLFCVKCFHYASPHPRLLLHPCQGRPCPHKSSEMFYLKKRRHPVFRTKLLKPMRVEVHPV